MRYEDGIKFAKVKSKRLKSVLDDIHVGDEHGTVNSGGGENLNPPSNDKGDAKPKAKRQRKR